MVATGSADLKAFLESIGLRTVSSNPAPKTYTVIDSQKFTTKMLAIRDNAGWKKAQHVVLEECDSISKTELLEKWLDLTADGKYQQYLYYPNGDGKYEKINAHGEPVAVGALKELFMVNETNLSDKPLQQITYGAPGTGKSYGVKKEVAGESVIRTTFHPDSDYATFVGAYKPTMESCEAKKVNQHLTVDQLAAILKKAYEDAGEGSDKGKALAVDLFAEEYYDYLDGAFGKVSLMELVSKAGLTKGYTVGLRDSLNVAKYHAQQHRGEKRIVYKFVPQTFLQAYEQAWKFKVEAAQKGGTAKRQYLVIEEINRGNCAQIFGDLFQLLDRNDAGFSDYEIVADEDLRRHLAEQFADAAKANEATPLDLGIDLALAKRVLSGEALLLPDNLFIRATMNTSDQSLFPIDSAFKRRWDWKYVPICDAGKGWKIKVHGAPGTSHPANGTSAEEKMHSYDWWRFLEIVNKQILDTTNSEDKQLGYFFVKAPDATGEISARQFTGKVLFYLYNDVFRDDTPPASLFGDGTGDTTQYRFRMFFDEQGEPKEDVVAAFLEQLFKMNAEKGKPAEASASGAAKGTDEA